MTHHETYVDLGSIDDIALLRQRIDIVVFFRYRLEFGVISFQPPQAELQ